MKFSSPLLGFNNNVKHKGKVFHVQTEDSGIKHPHIMTHLFADGGRILKSKKTSYAEHLGDEDMAKTVRNMMKEQHKAMFIALRAGTFDELIDPTGGFARLGKNGQLKADATAKPDAASAPDAAKPDAAPMDPAPAAPAEPAAAPAPPPAPAVPVSTTQPDATDGDVPLGVRDTLLDPVEHAAAIAAPIITTLEPPASRPATQRPGAKAPPITTPVHIGIGSLSGGPRANVTRPMMPKVDAVAAAPTAVEGPKSAPMSRPLAPDMPMTPPESDDGGIELDLDALERAAREAQTPVYQQIRNLPPPPAAVLGAKMGRAPAGMESTSYRSITPPSPSTSYRSATPPSTRSDRRAPTEPPREASDPPPSRRSRPTPQEGKPPKDPRQEGRQSPVAAPTGRYAPSRPASIFGSDRPAEGASIFGEELISEKSLDEVILGYLAEDLEGPSKK